MRRTLDGGDDDGELKSSLSVTRMELAMSNILFQSSSHLIERQGSFRICHLFALNPKLFLQKVNTNSFLVAFGEGAPAISGKEKVIKTNLAKVSRQYLWIMLDLPTAPFPTISTCKGLCVY